MARPRGDGSPAAPIKVLAATTDISTTFAYEIATSRHVLAATVGMKRRFYGLTDRTAGTGRSIARLASPPIPNAGRIRDLCCAFLEPKRPPTKRSESDRGAIRGPVLLDVPVAYRTHRVG